MGSKAGHVGPGIGFLIIGLWHLFNHIKLHILHPLSYTGPPWFPVQNLRYAEPVFIMAGSTASILTELFISPSRHQPLDVDGTIPSNHLHTFEHASISLALLCYAALAVAVDKIVTSPDSGHRLTYFAASVALAQEFLLFRLHSADHAGPEGHYHFFLQLAVAVTLATTLAGVACPGSFMASFVRSLSVVFQGVWFIVTGVMLWTPEFLPKGCFIDDDDGRKVARCSGEESLHRAKALINLEFSWYLTLTTAFGVSFYFVLLKIYGAQKVEYSSLPRNIQDKEEEQDSDDIEFQKRSS